MQKISTILILTFLAFGGFTTASTIVDRFLPYSGFHPIPLKTPGPIDIQVGDVKNITTFPLALLINGLEKGLAKNTGYSVILDETATSNAIVGGVLGLNLYVFRKIRFYWAGSPDGVAATTVDGENGTPLEVCIFYYNVKYGSFHNALNFRDGLLELIFRINVGSVPNLLFTPFAATLKQIQKAKSQVEFPIITSFLFYILFPPVTKYFIYPSVYINESTGIMHYCSSSIIAPLTSTHFISKQQFQETFLSLRDDDGKSLVNQAKQFPRGNRPVVQSTGIFEIPNFVKIPSNIGH